MNRPQKLLLGVVALTAVAGCTTRASQSTATPAADASQPTTTAAAADVPAPVPTATPEGALGPEQTPAPRRAWRAGNGKMPPADETACVACAND